MSFEMIIVFGLLLLAAVLFVTERVSFDITALIILSVLLITGILTLREGFSGFSNQATITTGAMFIPSEGVRLTGALSDVSTYFSRLGKRHHYFAVFIMIMTLFIQVFWPF
ncbi:MAG TPA: SLC13 family permease [bacterium]|nr:SLC13 family permease [bacterium]